MEPTVLSALLSLRSASIQGKCEIFNEIR